MAGGEVADAARARGESLPGGSPRPTLRLLEAGSPGAAAGPEGLAIRWFTPRGRALRQELLLDLRHEDGANLRSLLDELRRPGAVEGAIDLRAIDLHGEDLAAVQLPGADLRGANLDGCDLSCANLRGARLAGARLRDAKLRGATLDGVDLTDADLSRADLSESRLSGATLHGARLRGAQLRRALLEGVQLDGVDTAGVDLSLAFRRAPGREVTVRRVGAGAPPVSEPRAPADRVAARVTGRLDPPQARVRAGTSGTTPEAPARAGASGTTPEAPVRAGASGTTREAAEGLTRSSGTIIPHDSLRIARAALQAAAPRADAEAFDEALVELIRLRGRVSAIRVVVDGEERALLDGEVQARQRLG